MDFLTVFFSTVVILALAGVVSALRSLYHAMEKLPDKNTMIKLIEELQEMRSSIDGISQKIREDGRREMMEPGVWTLAENRDQANPDLIEVLEDIRDK